MNEIITMQELGMSNDVHLCKSCCHDYPECNANCIIFGTGEGQDNVAACNIYEAITFKNPR